MCCKTIRIDHLNGEFVKHVHMGYCGLLFLSEIKLKQSHPIVIFQLVLKLFRTEIIPCTQRHLQKDIYIDCIYIEL